MVRDSSAGQVKSHKAPPWRSLFNFTTRRHLLYLLAGLLSAIISGATIPVNAYLLGSIFESFTAYANDDVRTTVFRKDITKYAGYVAINGTASWLFNFSAYAFWHIFGDLQSQCAREKVLLALLSKPMAWFDRRTEGVSALSSRISFLARELQVATALPACLTIQYLATFLGSAILALYLSWKLTLIVIAGLPFVAALVPLVSSRFQKHNEAQAIHLTRSSQLAAVAFNYIETVKCYSGEETSSEQYKKSVSRSQYEYGREVFWQSLQTAIMRLATLAMFVQGFWFGTALLNKAQISPGAIVATFWAAILAVQALINVMPHLLMLEKGRAAGHKLRAITRFQDGDELRHIDGDHVSSRAIAGDIEFKSVSFAYPTRPMQLALDNVNLFFAAGETTFLVGKSGSGKSTIGQLLVKFYQPTYGLITLDSAVLCSDDFEHLRTQVLLVEQQSVLFTGSIADNIKLGCGRRSVESADVQSATRFSSVHNAIELMPAGLETRVGPRGDTLSGGQRQRIALARAWLRDPAVLILDESTSALDHVNRAAVMSAIRKWRTGRTTIIITHDMSQILPGDFVYALENGKVAEAGFKHPIKDESALKLSQVKELGDEAADPQKHHPGRTHALSNQYATPTLSQHLSSRSHDADVDYNDLLDLYMDEQTPQSKRLSVLLPLNFDRSRASQDQTHFDAGQSHVAAFWSLRSHPVRQSHKPSPLQGAVANLRGDDPAQPFIRQARPDASIDDVGQGSNTTKDAKPWTTVPVEHGIEMQTSVEQKLVRSSDEASRNSQTSNISLRYILATFWPSLAGREKCHAAVATLACVIYAVSTPMFSYFFGKLLSTIYDASNRQSNAQLYSLVLLAISVIDAVAMYIMNLELARSGQYWINRLRTNCFELVLAQSREFFNHDTNDSTRLVEVLTTHAEMMQHTISRFAGSMLVIAVMTLCAVTWSFATCWKLTAVLLACSPIIYVISWATETAGGRLDALVTSATEDSSVIFSETITSITTVKALTLEQHFRAKHSAAVTAALKLGVKRAIVCGSLFGLAESTVIFLTALLFYYGSVLLVNQEYSLQSIIQVFTLLLFSFSSVNVILCSLPQMSLSRDAATRVLRLARLAPHCHEHQGSVRVEHLGDIRIKNLTFAYPEAPDTIVLDRLDLNIAQGQCLAIVGQSGCGKSTVASLLLKLYPATAIHIGSAPHRDHVVADTSLNRMNTGNLRFLVTMVSQKPTLFPMTVAENITYGLRAGSSLRTKAHIEAAARAAGAHEFISGLSDAYDTVVGEGGTGLSGGQAQRIAIARALVRRPQVLILDEVTSALDQESAELIRQTIRALLQADRNSEKSRRMTVIIITHSQEMMQMADSVCVLDRGRVVEQGHYVDLISRNGAFARLVGSNNTSD